MTESLTRRLGAEFLGTFVLVFVGCGGAAILDAGNKGIDLLGVAFGVAVMVMIYAVGAVCPVATSTRRRRSGSRS